MNKKLISMVTVITLVLLFSWTFAPQNASAAVPGLPFTEDFTDSALRDAGKTNANWSTDEEALLLNWRQARYGVFEPGLTGSNISGDMHNTGYTALGDMDGDGDLDLVAGNYSATNPNRLYLNNGTADPFNGVTGLDISSDTDDTTSIALGDVDGDGDLDMLAGNDGQTHRLYLNNGTADPFSGVAGSNISSDTHRTQSIALGDVDGDGDLDLVIGNNNYSNRLYLNNGTSNPFNGVTGLNISSDVHSTESITLGDVDGDGDLDMLAGNLSQVNRLYLNDGSSDPFNSVAGSDISSDTHYTISIALADVDGDGDLDLLAGNANNQTNRLYLNNGTADPFSGVSGSDISADGHQTFSIALGDMDGDGDLDMLAGNHNETNRLYLNDGSVDPFSGVTGSDISSDAHETKSIALGDVDGDGDLDLAAGSYSATNPNRLYLNEGNPNPFTGVAGSNISSDMNATLSIALGDVDGDGDLDLVAGNYNSYYNRLYLNNGTADPFSGVTGSNISSDAHLTKSIGLADVDGDGDLDLVAGNFNETNRLYLNNGSADPFSGVSGLDISSDTHNTVSIILGDIDGDGDLDLVEGNYCQTTYIYMNNGTSNPFNGVAGLNIGSDMHITESITLGDVDGDGDLDLVEGNEDEVNRLYLNNGTADPFSGVTGSEISSDTHKTWSVALADIDGDGDLDMLAGNKNQANRLYLNDGSASPFSGVTGSDISSDTHYTYSIALGDVDGDGDLDLVAGNNGANCLYLNNGTADPFSGVTGSDISSDVHDTRSIALADVDGDGDLDLVAGDDIQTNRLYLNNGSPDPFNGVSDSDISSNKNDTRSIGLGDVDGDGDLDLVAGDNGQTNHLYLNNGTVHPFNGVTGSDISSDAHNTWSVALGDLDGDGDLDLVEGNYNQANRLYLNNGTADPFNGVTGSDISSDAHNTTSIALADVDGDGDLDLLAGNWNQTNRLYLNNGSSDPFSGVATGSNISSDTLYTYSIALGDMDGDGDLDLVAGNNGNNRLYLNDGTADPFGVVGSDISTDTYETSSIALGDVDGDGDLDLLAGNTYGNNRLYLNNGTWDPFSGVTGTNISSDAHATTSIALGDMDWDGDLDLVAGNYNQRNRLYLNNGSADPFNGVAGSDISGDAHETRSITLGDVDGDGDLDLLAGNVGSTNRLYLKRDNYHTAHGLATSLRVDTESSNITRATLTASADLPINTRVTYYLSNNGGARWYIVQSGIEFTFPSIGMDLRWKAELESLSPILTPKVNQIQIEVEDYYNFLPLIFK